MDGGTNRSDSQGCVPPNSGANVVRWLGDDPEGAGDRLLLYSDGVTQRRNNEGGRIGENGLRAVLSDLGPCSPAMTVRGLQDAVLAASSAPLHDDATLLVMAPRT